MSDNHQADLNFVFTHSEVTERQILPVRAFLSRCLTLGFMLGIGGHTSTHLFRHKPCLRLNNFEQAVRAKFDSAVTTVGTCHPTTNMRKSMLAALSLQGHVVFSPRKRKQGDRRHVLPVRPGVTYLLEVPRFWRSSLRRGLLFALLLICQSTF